MHHKIQSNQHHRHAAGKSKMSAILQADARQLNRILPLKILVEELFSHSHSFISYSFQPMYYTIVKERASIKFLNIYWIPPTTQTEDLWLVKLKLIKEIYRKEMTCQKLLHTKFALTFDLEKNSRTMVLYIINWSSRKRRSFFKKNYRQLTLTIEHLVPLSKENRSRKVEVN